MNMIIVSRAPRYQIGLFLLALLCAISAVPAHAQIAPPPPSIGAKVATTYFGPMPVDVQRELIGQCKLLKAGEVD